MRQVNALRPSCDVLIIGGGLAGPTAAALLAERRRRVVVVEKDRHPRFHIGESLLPLNLALFEQLGVHQQIAAIGIVKYGAEFISADDQRTVTFNFADVWDKTWTSAYQVRRSEFDHILLKNASARGAEVHEDSRVTDIQFNDDSADVMVTTADGPDLQWRAGYVLDASGRDTFLASRMQFKRRNTKHASTALYGHFTNVRRLLYVRQALAEIARALTPGGLLVIAEPSPMQLRNSFLSMIKQYGWRGGYFQLLASLVYEPYVRAWHRFALIDEAAERDLLVLEEDEGMPVKCWLLHRGPLRTK